MVLFQTQCKVKNHLLYYPWTWKSCLVIMKMQKYKVRCENLKRWNKLAMKLDPFVLTLGGWIRWVGRGKCLKCWERDILAVEGCYGVWFLGDQMFIDLQCTGEFQCNAVKNHCTPSTSGSAAKKP
jgi:hypothetical protein